MSWLFGAAPTLVADNSFSNSLPVSPNAAFFGNFRTVGTIDRMVAESESSNSLGKVGEKEIFAQTAEWMDYSGTQPGDHKEGVTFFDHPSNPGHPTAWHVREDGWMGAANCLSTPRMITAKETLTLRYQLHAHKGMLDPQRAAKVFKEFADRSPMVLVKAPAKSTAFKLERAKK